MKKIFSALLALFVAGVFAASLCACDEGFHHPGGSESRNEDDTVAADTAGADTAGAETEPAVILPFIERVSGTYHMSGLAVYHGDEDHYYTDSGTNELNVRYDVTVKPSDGGNADVTIDYGEGSNSDPAAVIDEDAKTITFKVPYAWGYEYDCTMTFNEDGKRVEAELHMHVEGTNWEEKQVSEDVDLSGYKG